MRAHLIETSALEELLLDVHEAYRTATDHYLSKTNTHGRRAGLNQKAAAWNRAIAYEMVAKAIERKIRGEVST